MLEEASVDAPRTPLRTRLPRGAKAAKYMEWVLTPETKFRRALSGVASKLKAAMPSPDHALADRIFDALDGPAVDEAAADTADAVKERVDPVLEVATNTVELLPSSLVADMFETPGEDTSAAQLAVMYSSLQRKFLEQHADTERKCHDIYEAAMHQRLISEKRAKQAANGVAALRLENRQLQAHLSHVQAELQGASAQKEMIRVQRDGVIAAQAHEIRSLQADLKQTLEDGGLAPTADLTLKESQARRYQSRIQELETALAEADCRIRELEQQGRERDGERYELMVANNELMESVEAMQREVDEIQENEHVRRQQAVEQARTEERADSCAEMEAQVTEMRARFQAVTREAVAEAEALLLQELEQTSMQLAVCEGELRQQREAGDVVQLELKTLREEHSQLERQRAKDARRHKKAAAAGAQAAAAALAQEFSQMVEHGLYTPSRDLHGNCK